MYSNWLILILFGISWNFPNILTFGGSGVPFAFIFPSILVLPNFVKAIFFDKEKIHIKSLVFLIILLFTIIFSVYSIQFDLREYIIRVFQIGSAFVVYFYVRNRFYLDVDYIKPFKILIILQLPSLIFGFLEVINTLLNVNALEKILILIRTITATARADIVSMNTITLHFFEHSMAAFYFISIAIIIFMVYQTDKKLFLKQNKLYNFSITLFFILFLFHRSTTFYLLLLLFSILFIIKSRNIYLGILFILFISLGIILSGTILTKITYILNGSIIASDLFRFTSMMSGFWNFVSNPILGTGPGTWSVNYLDGLYNLFDTIEFDKSFQDLVILNGYVVSFENGGRAPLNSAYMALLSEYGIIFILFFILFHFHSFLMRSNSNILELTILGGLFLGYPLAYPYFWFALGMLHSDFNLKKI